MYSENYNKKILRELKEDLNKWENILFRDWKGDAKRSIPPKFVYSENAVPANVSGGFVVDATVLCFPLAVVMKTV